MPLCLERAGVVPLVVDITVSDIRGDSSLLASLIPCVSRISCLSLEGYPSIEAVAEDLPGLFAAPMSNLASLELRQAIEPAELFPLNEIPVPPVFQNVSNLKSLRLTRTPIYSTLFGVTSLVELKLTGYTNPFHFGVFIRFLASNINLEIVDLGIKFIEGSVWETPVQMTSLAHLRSLSITCSEPIFAKGLLSCISLPPGICLEVSCLQWTSLGMCLPSPPTNIHAALAPITAIRFQAAPREIRVSGNGGSLSFRCPQPQFWNPELHLFPTTSVREFHVDIAPWTFTPAFFVSLFTRLPALEILVVTNSTCWPTGLFDSLAGQPPLCPSLKTMAFFNCGLTPEAVEEFEGMVARRKGSTSTWLYQVVIVSSTRALPDYTLVERLKQHVPRVDVRMDDKLPDLS